MPVDWLGAERLFENHDWLRSRVGGQVLNWYLRLDRQVEHLHGDAGWPAEQFEAALADVLGSGDEVGTHPHNWRWTGEGWFPDGTTSWVVENAALSIEAYATVFGVAPPSFRYGDRFVSDEVVRLLLLHPDIKVDLTTEPGARACRGLVEAEGATGITRHVDHRLSRRYRPDGGAVDIPSETEGLTMVPLTAGAIPGTGVVDTLTLWRQPEEFDRMLRVRLLDRELDHLAFAIRSDLALMPRAVEHVEANLDTLARCVDDLEWVRASSLALQPNEESDQGLGLVGSLATVVDDVIRVIHPESPIVVAPVADAVREIVERNDHLAGQLAASSAAHAEAELALVAQRARAAELADAVDAERTRADDLRRRLEVIEQTKLWRIRTHLLPVLRPLAKTHRCAIKRWQSMHPSDRSGAPM